MGKQLNIRRIGATALFFVVIVTTLMLGVGNAYGRYGTTVPNVLRCMARSDDKLYVQGLGETEGILEIQRNELANAPEWKTKGGEQYVSFTVSNGDGAGYPENDISFRIRAIVPINDENEGDISKYSSLSLSLDSDGGKYRSQIDNINPKTAFAVEKGINGLMYRFNKTANNEIIYTLEGGKSDEITFTLSVLNTELDCSDILIYIDRTN